MQTIVSQLESAFRTAIRAAFDLDADPLVAPAQNEKFGDYQSNAAMGLAKTLFEKTGQKTNPRAVAEQIKSKLQLGAMAGEVSIAGPGFINVRLAGDWLVGRLDSLFSDVRLGVEPVVGPQNVVVDYSGPNIAKELHVGHLRSTNIGDALVRIIGFQGHHVIRQNHLGDWGTQFGMLITNLQEQQNDNAASQLKDLEAFYVQAKQRFDAEPDFQSRARQNVVKLQSGDPLTLTAWRTLVEKTREHYLPLYGRLGVLLTPEDERGESFYNDMLSSVVADLKAADVAEESDGAIVVFTDGKDRAPLIIQKTGGGYLYGTTDLAAVRFRVQTLHAQRIIYLVDARQNQHLAQVFATARRAGWAEGVTLEHAAFGTMLGEDGKPLATRKGGNIKLKELFDEAEERALKIVAEKNPDLPEADQKEVARSVGIGAVKYYDLARDRTTDYVFSFDRILDMNGNTAPYLQYAYARTRSVLREAAARGIAYNGPTGPLHLSEPHEFALVRHILRLQEVLDIVARELKPHHLCGYLYELATRMSGFWENCPVLKSEDPVRASRLALSDLTGRTLALGLDLLGIEHPQRM